jgi:Fe-S-cluster containining protein
VLKCCKSWTHGVRFEDRSDGRPWHGDVINPRLTLSLLPSGFSLSIYANPIDPGDGMPPKDFKCKQCGHCCLHLYDAFTTCATDEDINMWKRNGRRDILKWVDPIPIGEDKFVYDIWISPVTGEDVMKCPWLKKLPGKAKYICRIHDVKPEHCRDYPRSREHGEKTGCRGFEE